MARNRKSESALGVVLPITPMLDMTFQLLTFFIFTYHPAAIEGELSFSLPVLTNPRGDVPDPGPLLPPDIDTSENEQINILLKAQRDGIHDGVLSAVLVQPAGGGETALAGLDELHQYLDKQRVTGALKTTGSIRLQSEGKLKYAFVIKAMDSCKQAGFVRIDFVPPPDLGQQN